MDNVLFIIFVVFSALFGCVIGSFLNVVIYRIPENKTIVKGHSMCMSCGHELGVLDLFPVFSWLFLKGKCRYCKAPISSRYIKIESFTGLTFVLLALTHKYCVLDLNNVNAVSLALFLCFCVVLIDLCGLIASMMIYYDHGKGMYGFTVFSGLCAVAYWMIYSFCFKDWYEMFSSFLTASSLALLLVGFLALCCSLVKKKYTLNDFWLDINFAFFYTYFGNFVIDYALIITSYLLLGVLPRFITKGTRFEKHGGILSMLGILIVIILGYFLRYHF